MSRVTITINGEVIMDGNPGDWSANPPAILTEQLKANAKPKPWMRALMLTLADVAMAEQDASITVVTKPGEWVLTVSDAG